MKWTYEMDIRNEYIRLPVQCTVYILIDNTKLDAHRLYKLIANLQLITFFISNSINDSSCDD